MCHVNLVSYDELPMEVRDFEQDSDRPPRAIAILDLSHPVLSTCSINLLYRSCIYRRLSNQIHAIFRQESDRPQT
ncbi:MAG: hypothetical protein EA367_04940 [Leptolyngbya sp. DLM2.Bin15]|nr:MAG: hypothetical protein EA367_04940 [Leptolyngbya sp. DLM2.Bin15]